MYICILYVYIIQTRIYANPWEMLAMPFASIMNEWVYEWMNKWIAKNEWTGLGTIQPSLLDFPLTWLYIQDIQLRSITGQWCTWWYAICHYIISPNCNPGTLQLSCSRILKSVLQTTLLRLVSSECQFLDYFFVPYAQVAVWCTWHAHLVSHPHSSYLVFSPAPFG